MIPEEDLTRWAGLYDLGHRNLDGWSDPRAKAARDELENELMEAYARLGLSVHYGEFHRHAIRRMIAFLKDKPPSI